MVPLSNAPQAPFERLCWIMDRLLSPEGCPWDREQSHSSLKQYLIEEAYEVYDAVESGDMDHLQEELGDVALQVVFHAALAKEAGHFDVEAVLQGICEKLIRRHPHVFADGTAENSGEVLKNWEQIKQAEKKAGPKKDKSLVGGIPRALPALQKAHRMQEKTARVGFEWPDVAGALEKVREEFAELDAEVVACGGKANAAMEEEVGDLLFALVNVTRYLKIQPEEALQKSCDKFARRFRYVESRAEEAGVSLKEAGLERMDGWWNAAKEEERKNGSL